MGCCTVLVDRASVSRVSGLIEARGGDCVSGSVEWLMFRKTDMTRRETDSSQAITDQLPVGQIGAFCATAVNVESHEKK